MNYISGRVLQEAEEGYGCGQCTKICFGKDFEKRAHRPSQIIQVIASQSSQFQNSLVTRFRTKFAYQVTVERRMYIYMHDCIVREELIDRRLPMHGKRRKRAASESTSSAYERKGIDFVCLWNAGPTELYTTAHNPIRKKKKIRQTLLRVPPPVAAAPGSLSDRRFSCSCRPVHGSTRPRLLSSLHPPASARPAGLAVRRPRTPATTFPCRYAILLR